MDDTNLPTILSSDEVLVKIVAASVDPVDIKVASGYARTLRRLFTTQNQVSAEYSRYLIISS